MLDREIVGAHAIDAPNPTRWLDEDWVLLASGLSFRSEAAQRELVRELADHGIAGLGLTINLYFEDVPEALARAADERGLAVFSVPLDTRFSHIIEFISQARLSRDTYTLRRAFSIQRYLMEALETPEPEGIMVQRLASVLQGSVVVFDPLGAVVASRGKLRRPAIWRELVQRPDELQRFTSGSWSVVSTPVRTDEAVRYWLVVATQNEAVFEQLAKPAVEAAEHLLALISRSHDAARREQRALKATLLRDVIEGRLTRWDQPVIDRLRGHGFTDSLPCRGLVIELLDTNGADRAKLLEQIESLLASRGHPVLFCEEGAGLVGLIEGVQGELNEDLSWAHDCLAEGGTPTLIGVGRLLDEQTAVIDSIRDARLALTARGIDRRSGTVVPAERLDLVAMTLGLEGADSIVSRAEQLLAPVAENEPLMTTLETYFDTGLDVGKTAKRLHLHPNSVRYRLGQIEKHLGMRIDHPDTIANLHLALKARCLSGDARAHAEDGAGPEETRALPELD